MIQTIDENKTELSISKIMVNQLEQVVALRVRDSSLYNSIFYVNKNQAINIVMYLTKIFDLKEETSKDKVVSAPEGELPKPPLGIMPQYLYIEKRMNDIMKATERYMVDNQQVPDAWVVEYSQLAKQYKELTSKTSPSL